MLRTMCPAFNWIFYERDKNAAHKDSDYKINLDISLFDVIVKMKNAISNTTITGNNHINKQNTTIANSNAIKINTKS